MDQKLEKQTKGQARTREREEKKERLLVITQKHLEEKSRQKGEMISQPRLTEYREVPRESGQARLKELDSKRNSGCLAGPQPTKLWM